MLATFFRLPPGGERSHRRRFSLVWLDNFHEKGGHLHSGQIARKASVFFADTYLIPRQACEKKLHLFRGIRQLCSLFSLLPARRPFCVVLDCVKTWGPNHGAEQHRLLYECTIWTNTEIQNGGMGNVECRSTFRSQKAPKKTHAIFHRAICKREAKWGPRELSNRTMGI